LPARSNVWRSIAGGSAIRAATVPLRQTPASGRSEDTNLHTIDLLYRPLVNDILASRMVLITTRRQGELIFGIHIGGDLHAQ